MANAKELIPDLSGKMKVENSTREIYWEYFGKREKEVVCLLNGLAMDTRSWMTVLPQVYPEFDVLLYNYFGQAGPPGQESSCLDEPYFIPKFAGYLAGVMDIVGVKKIHIMGVSYGGFVAADFARLFPERTLTITLSGIILQREMFFQIYQDLSLLFYRSGDKVFEVYTHYMYEKIFGQNFAAKIYGETMEKMRQNFYARYNPKKHCLIRLTEAQNPYFAATDENPMLYSAIKAPMLILAGEEDRTIPIWVQRKIPSIVPDTRFIPLPECGHLTYLEQPDLFWSNLRAFMRAKKTDY